MRWILAVALTACAAHTAGDAPGERASTDPIVCADYADRVNYADEHDCPDGYTLTDEGAVCVDETGAFVGWAIVERGNTTYYNWCSGAECGGRYLSFTCEAGPFAVMVLDYGVLTYFNGHTGAVTDQP